MVVLCACTALTVAALASAATFKVKVGKLEVTLGGTVSPSKLPKGQLAPVRTNIVGEIATTDNSHPPALREVVVDIDQDAAIDSTGLQGGSARRSRHRQRKEGVRRNGRSDPAHAEIQFPEQPRIVIPSPITVFNGGTSGGKPTPKDFLLRPS